MESNPPIEIHTFDESMQVETFSEQGMKWISPKQMPAIVSGFPWFEQDNMYRRLPLRPNYPLSANVHALADCTAGGQLRFNTNSGRVAVKVKLAGSANMYHMPSTGQCGFDCYCATDRGIRYMGTSRYDHTRTTEYSHLFFETDTSAIKQIILHFPLYQGVRDVFVGVDERASVFQPYPFANRNKIVFYGTSITQGGCASRPGMCYTNIISRKLNIECVNLGFAGSALGEPEIAGLIGELRDVCCVVLDYEANANDRMYDNLEPFIRILRGAFETIPIMVVSRIRYAVESFSPEAAAPRLKRLAFQQQLVERLRSRGDAQLFFYDGSRLLDDDFDECTVDGEHPTDLGFYRMAEKLGKALADRL